MEVALKVRLEISLPTTRINISRPLCRTCRLLKYTLLQPAGLTIHSALSFRPVTVPNHTINPLSTYLRHPHNFTHLLTMDLVLPHYRKVTRGSITVHQVMRRLGQKDASMGKYWMPGKFYATLSSPS
ncbi:hypothetical protein XPA_009555 [Xanthoria parietina]